MAKVLYHVTMSLDGFITGPGGDMSWIHDYIGGARNDAVAELLANIGSLLIGERTYRGGESGPGAGTAAGKPYGGAWAGPMFVLTHDATEPAEPAFTLLDGDLPTAVQVAKAAAGDGYAVVFGATTAARCLEAGLLDEILVHVAPVMLGDGVRLFSRPGGRPVKLDRIRVDEAPPIVNQWFRVIKD